MGPVKGFAVFTAIFGNRDTLKEPLCPDVEFIVFTDQPLQSNRVRIVRMQGPYLDPARNARHVRALVHKYLPEYGVTLWLDSTMLLKKVDGLSDYLKTRDLAVSKHDQRDCAYDEARACVQLGRDRKEIVEAQMQRYEKEGYPKRNGLVAVGALLRRNTEAVVRFNEAWWREIETGSRHDQVSFNYVAWKLGFQYQLFDWNNVRRTPFWSHSPHAGPEPAPVLGKRPGGGP